MMENQLQLCDQIALERLVRQYLRSSEGIHQQSTNQLPIMPIKPASTVNESISSDAFASHPLSSRQTCKHVERSNSARSMTSQITTSSPRHDLNSRPIEAGNSFAGHRSLQRTASDPISVLNQSSFPLSTESGNVTEAVTGDIGTLSCRFKTELCRSFEEHGTCKYGEKCQFAHGRRELRVVSRHPKYKTDLCKTYHTTGLCPYGSRCHFIHRSDEDSVAHQRVVEERMKIGKEQELLVLQQQLQRQQQRQQQQLQQQQQQQQQQQELLLTAMMQAARKRHLSQLSASVTSPKERFSSSTSSQISSIGIFPSLYDPFDSVANSSISSSESDSPVPSPTHSMFGSDDVNSSSDFVCESLPSHISKFNWAYPRQSSMLGQFGPSNSESNFSLSITPTPESFSYPKLNSSTDYQESQTFTWPQAEPSTSDVASLISGLSALSIDNTLIDNFLLAELLKAVSSTKAC